MNKNRILIIDGNALVHRSFHALPLTMMTKDGIHTNAVYGFVSFLLKALKELNPKYVVVTFDRKAPTFRHERYEKYKAHRIKAPDELYEQIPLVKRVVEAFNIPIYEMDGYEADDLIGTIAKTIEDSDGETENVIVTGDADTFQLIGKRTKVYTMSRGLSDSVLYDREKIEEKYGLKVGQLIDYKALRGDPSDNIPGVKGIGEKTAVSLLQKFGNVDRMYAEIERGEQGGFSERIIRLLIEHKEDAILSRELATIKCDVEMDFNLEKTRFGGFVKDEIFEAINDFEFKSLLPRVNEVLSMAENERSEAAPTADKFARNKSAFRYVMIDSQNSYLKFLSELRKQESFTFDTETTSLDALDADLLGISFSWGEGSAYYLDLRIAKEEAGKEEVGGEKSVQNSLFPSKPLLEKSGSLKAEWLEPLKKIFEDEKIKKCGHNMKYDVRVLQAFGIDTEGCYFDTMLASYLLNPGSRQHGLDNIVFAEFGWEKISVDDLLGEKKSKQTFAEVADNSPEKIMLYSCEDADFTNRLVSKFEKDLSKNNLDKMFGEIEMPLMKVLCDMENSGIMIDAGTLAALETRLKKEADELQKRIWEAAGEIFNINSTKQLKEILFEKLKISSEGIAKKKTGFSTAADELEKMKDKHEIIKPIQEYRELMKLLSTYIESLPKLINRKTGRIHTSYNQAVAATGRLSSTDPNLQNIPVRTEYGREIRKAFIAKKGWVLASFDYSQIELRLAAHYSKDQNLIDAFKNGVDIHTATAAQINEVNIDGVTKEMRREAKATNFGILYGQGAHGLSQAADIPYNTAKEFIAKYFQTFPGIKNYIDETIEKTKSLGYVETLFGRRRYLPDINASAPLLRKSAERMAINTPLQGTAADMLKVAMIAIYDEIKSFDDIKMLLQVHDELVFEIKEGKVDKYSAMIKKNMESVVNLEIPIVVDLKIGKNWGEME